MAAIIFCDICNKKVSDYTNETRLKNQIVIGDTYKDKIGSMDTCRNCREKIEDFIFKMMEENKDDNTES